MQRATTTGLVISGFGLSAFVFSTIAHVIFPGNTSEFLLILAIGTSLPMVMGFFLVKPVPLPISETADSLEHGLLEEDDEFSTRSPVFQRENNSHTHLLAQSDEQEVLLEEEEVRTGSVELHHRPEVSDYLVPGAESSVPLGSPIGSPGARHRSRSSTSVPRSSLAQNARRMIDGLPNIHGLDLARSSNFWILFVANSLCKSICRGRD